MGLAMKKSLEQYANKENIPLTTLSAKLKGRNSKSVCKTFHRAGLVVPYDRKTDVGYRQLAESDGKKMENFIHRLETIFLYFSEFEKNVEKIQ